MGLTQVRRPIEIIWAEIISIGLRTWVSPIYRAPNAVIKAQDSFVITNIHSNYHLYISDRTCIRSARSCAMHVQADIYMYICIYVYIYIYILYKFKFII